MNIERSGDMKRGCGEGRHVIEGNDFFVVSRLDADGRFPNTNVCRSHFSRIPETEFKESADGIEGHAYQALDIKNGEPSRYLTHEAMKKYLPKALKVIKSYDNV